MSWDIIFLLSNYWAFAGWIALAFLPRGPKILAAILYAGVFLLCLAYTILIVGFLIGGIDPGGASGADFTTLKGVMKLFDSPGGATMGRSEEHTSELQSLMRNSYAVFCLKKKI